MRDWAHHHRTDTVDDPVFRAAMQGYDSVSFVFSLEVTWSKIQQRQQEEEDQKALEELQALQELQEENEEAKDDTNDSDDVKKDDASEKENEENGQAESIDTASMKLEDVNDDEAAKDVFTPKNNQKLSSENKSTPMELEDSDDGTGRESDKEISSAVEDEDDDRGEAVVAETTDGTDDEEIVVAATAETSSPSGKSSSGSETDSSSSDSSPERSVVGSTQDAEILESTQGETSPSSQAKPDSWNCEKCTYKNETGKRKCIICKANRPKAKSASAGRRGTKRSRSLS